VASRRVVRLRNALDLFEPLHAACLDRETNRATESGRRSQREARQSGLLETPGKVDVWPDSTQVLSGLALFWAAHPLLAVWPSSGLRPAEHC
jgi:hypothetical protein